MASSADHSPDETSDERAASAPAEEVFERFACRLIGLARTRLDRQTRQKLDPEDVVQSVFRSFFTRRDAGKFEIGGWEDLWKILVVLTVRKCARKASSLRAERRDVRREVSLAGETPGDDWPVPDREPTPDEVAVLVETVERLLSRADDVERQIILLRLQGHGPREISGLVGRVSERKVFRVLAQARKRLEEE